MYHNVYTPPSQEAVSPTTFVEQFRTQMEDIRRKHQEQRTQQDEEQRSEEETEVKQVNGEVPDGGTGEAEEERTSRQPPTTSGFVNLLDLQDEGEEFTPVKRGWRKRRRPVKIATLKPTEP